MASIFQLSFKHNEEEYLFNLSNHVIRNKKNDSWKELPVFMEEVTEMLPGKNVI